MIKGMTLPKGGSRLPLILGLVLGLVTAVLVVVVLTSSEESATVRDNTGGPGVPVVVAAQDIPAGTRLTESMLGVTNVPESVKLLNAYGTLEGVTNQVTKFPLVAGEQVIPSKLSSTAATCVGTNCPLALVVEPGQRGVSVAVSSLIGAGGNIRPGDLVDVILIVEVKPEGNAQDTSGTSDQFAATILQSVKVLAIDTNITNPNADASADPGAGQSADEAATTLTLQVTPTQSEVLAMADVCGANHGGRLAVSLRAAGDTSKFDSRPVYAENGPPPLCSGVLGIASFGE